MRSCHPRALPAALLAALLSSCQGCGATSSAPPAPSAAQPEQGAQGSATSQDRGAAAPPAAAEVEPPALALRAETLLRGRLQLVLQNRADAEVHLQSAVTLERRQGDGFVAVEGVPLSLRAGCDRPAAACVALVPGGELRPAALRAVQGDSQCGCAGADTCPALPAGEYRFAVRGCEAPYRFAGEVFSMGRRARATP